MKLFWLFLDLVAIIIYSFLAALIACDLFKRGPTLRLIFFSIVIAHMVSTHHFGRGWVEPYREKTWRKL